MIRLFKTSLFRTLQRKKTITLISCALLCVWLLTHISNVDTSDLTQQFLPLTATAAIRKTPIVERFYIDLFNSINQYRPLNPPSNPDDLRDTEKCKWHGDISVHDFDKFNEYLSYNNLNECYKLSNIQLNNLKRSHSGFVESILSEFSTKDDKLTSGLFPNNEGIVTVGGGKYTVLLMTMIEKLRQSGTTLPLEVIIPPQDEGDDEFCNNVLPNYNGKCIYFKDVLPDQLSDKLVIKGFQLKPLAILLSSFKKALFLDADNLAMKDLDNIFNTQAFKQKRLIVWPDVWRRFTAPAYYKIANIKLDLGKRIRNLNDDVSPPSRYDDNSENSAQYLENVPFHDLKGTIPDPTSESGQMVIDKIEHFHTLILSLYYNLYGPPWYYRMFSQGTSGQGDKETFIAAAHALGKPYYQVHTKMGFKGYNDEKLGFQGVGLLQHDFEQDFKQLQLASKTINENESEYSKFKQDYKATVDFDDSLMKPIDGPIDIMFLHASFFKYEPLDLIREHRYVKEDGSHFRVFSGLERLNYFDLELFNFKILNKFLCTEEMIHFKYYKNVESKPEWSDMCKFLKEHTEYLESTHKEATAQVQH
ncbi:alpha-1,2-mannosyltransferase MNN5 NDAI_0A00780 [Naumovozyma dairenensis CBS 421]|uniref:Alpha-1,2-mannosyltransferase MNN5 n=1 Tax=Naumovozyma dairenensis (strain ATCC 10597 / BCRC 20456 / CBS 421 / NBRC 0211 / NRRL Y-12639) TaxID=1071378 RepID=G0W348_NAUDC|nr:hypothetical protein NDAI_0A00780 [Naumovozyma dairenensis CBS 421]CCD22236.1 hypothetical protein NDAI_0A00780 [Naumovozyma dairenensis CBS 421]